MVRIILNTCKKYKYWVILSFGLISFLFYLNFSTNSCAEIKFKIATNKSSNTKTFTSTCDCRNRENIILSKIIESQLNLFEVYSTLTNQKYYVTEQELNHIACGVHQTLRRNRHQKIIGYSLYGKNKKYSEQLEGIALRIKKLYPGWVMRIHHDNSIDPDIQCKLECLKDENGVLTDNVDFCNIEKVPGRQNKAFPSKRWLDNETEIFTWNATYMHAMKWRWFPINDQFVDIFMSRDSDSNILQREVDSVNEWLASGKVGHIMRDHPQHDAWILGGMWGYFNKQNRVLAKEIFMKIIDPKTASLYHKSGTESVRQPDQSFLKDNVYPLIKSQSIIHDSYSCKSWFEWNSGAFPTKRLGSCFIGAPGDNLNCENKTFYECPKKCRPVQHQDWTFC